MDAQRGTVVSEFDNGLASLAAAIEEARKHGVDPAVVKVDYNGTQMTMIECYDALAKQKTEALASFDASREELSKALAETA